MGKGTGFDFIWRGALLGALLMLASTNQPAHAQQVYRSVDADGHVVFSDRGSIKDAPATTIHVDQPNPKEVARLAKQQELLKAEDQQRQRQNAMDDKQKATDEQNKQQRCQAARNRYFQLKDSNRVFKRDADGNRIYYSDEDAEKLREEARRNMVAACES